MDAKQSRFRLAITVALALAGVGVGTSALLYRADLAMGQEPGDEPVEFQVPDEPVEDLPQPPVEEHPPEARQQPPQVELELPEDLADLVNGRNGQNGQNGDEPAAATTAPASQPAATQPAIPEGQLQQDVR